MNISFLGVGPILSTQKLSTQTNPALRQMPYDTVSFSEREGTLEEKFSAFADEIEEYTLTNKRFCPEKVRKIINSHYKDAKILPIRMIPDDLLEEDVHLACCHGKVKAESGGDVVLKSYLYIDKPRPKLPKDKIEFEDKVKFINDLNFSFIRLLQNQQGEKSCAALVREYLKDKKANKENASKAMAPEEIFKLNTGAMTNKVQKAIKMKQMLPTSMPEANEEYLRELIKKCSGRELETFLREIINKIISQTNVELTSQKEGKSSFVSSFSPEDEAEFLKSLELLIDIDGGNIYDFVEHLEKNERDFSGVIPDGMDSGYTLSFIELLAKNEAEAYALTLKRTKKLLNIEGPTDKDLIVMLYRKLGELAGEMKQRHRSRAPKEEKVHYGVCGIVQ